MSFDNLLISKGTVRRNIPGAQDAYGKPAANWADFIVDTPCRSYPMAEKEIYVGAEIVIADYKVFVGDIDITEQDRIEISGKTYEILSVKSCQDAAVIHHKECLVRVAR